MRRQKPKFRPPKLPRLYLDENFPVECIDSLSKLDIKHAALDLGFEEREDKFHFEFAKNEKRILITLDRDYQNDIKRKLSETFGVIIISVPSPVVPERINQVSDNLVSLLKSKNLDSFKGCKVFATYNGWTIWYIKNGKKIKEHYLW